MVETMTSSGAELILHRKSRSAPAQLRIFENGARSAHAPEISELDPELELKFRSGPTTVLDKGSTYFTECIQLVFIFTHIYSFIHSLVEGFL